MKVLSENDGEAGAFGRRILRLPGLRSDGKGWDEQLDWVEQHGGHR